MNVTNDIIIITSKNVASAEEIEKGEELEDEDDDDDVEDENSHSIDESQQNDFHSICYINENHCQIIVDDSINTTLNQPAPKTPSDDIIASSMHPHHCDGAEDEEENEYSLSLEKLSPKRDGEEVHKKLRRRKRRRYLTMNLSSCKYECVRRVARQFGFREVDEGDDWILLWTDYSVGLDKVMSMKSYQKINHFPGMSEICRKDLLARNMNRLWKQFPKDYVISPRTWCLPADYGDFQAFCRAKKNKTFILKPDSGSQGRGIFLTKNPKQDVKPGEDLICQQYIAKPFLIDGLKFDLRIYVLVTSCDPLRVFVYNDGLGRFSTVKYEEPSNNNLDNIYMHLTNYAIQKYSNEFVRDEITGSKRRLSVINKWFLENGYDLKMIWKGIDDVIIKTLISAHPILKHNYRTCFPNHVKGSACFEILGFDIILDRRLKAWVLEVNHSPSFTTDSKLDREIKDSLVHDTLVLVNFSLCDKRKYVEEERRKVRERLLHKSRDPKDKKEAGICGGEGANVEFVDHLKNYEDAHFGNFKRIYPEENEADYEQYFHSSCSLFQETATSKARTECARLQREEIKLKQEHILNMRRRNGIKEPDGMRPESGPKNQEIRRKKRCRKVLLKRPKDLRGRLKEFDSFNPHPIRENEELERVGNMLQRDDMLKNLGIPEFVYRLFKCDSKRKIEEHSENEVAVCEKATRSLPAMHSFPPSSLSTFETIKRSTGGNTLLFKPKALSHPSDDMGHTSPAFSSFKHHWSSSVTIALSKRDQQIMASTGMKFTTTARRSKILPRKQNLSMMNSNNYNSNINTNSPEIDINKVLESAASSYTDNAPVPDNETYRKMGTSRKTTGFYGADKTNILSVLKTQTSSPLEASPPIKFFKQEDRYRLNSFYKSNKSRGLSIISSPAPLQLRVDSADHFETLSNTKYGASKDTTGDGRRSTRAQRIRGASNNIRIKQMELLESRAAT